jgi:hypothetical protein
VYSIKKALKNALTWNRLMFLIKCWENVTILEEPRLIFQYRCIEIVLQEYLLDNEAYKEMDFHVPEPEFQNGQRV